ncbi:MAG: hypothetical protein KAW09_09050 [Thermoplasmata archaeon]|nr:hypothetical protein [Thermoplasmata archaeon]
MDVDGESSLQDNARQFFAELRGLIKQRRARIFALLMAVPVAISAVLYIPVDFGGWVNGHSPAAIHVEIISSSEAHIRIVYLFGGGGYASPDKLRVLLRNRTHEGSYTLPSNENNTFMQLERGDFMGMIKYVDFLDNERIDYLDGYRLTGLSPSTEYFFGVTYGSQESCWACATFTTYP